MKKCVLFFCLFASVHAYAFDILAFGTSATNCHGVARDRIFPVKLEEILRHDGFDAHVINAGIDGDKPVWMINRLRSANLSNIKLVILEPGPNERNSRYAMPYVEEMLDYLRTLDMPTIYTAHSAIQTEEEGQVTADKFNAYYYGHFGRNIPTDRVHRQFDYASTWGGHMTAEGCEAVARNMAPFVEKVITEKNIK